MKYFLLLALVVLASFLSTAYTQDVAAAEGEEEEIQFIQDSPDVDIVHVFPDWVAEDSFYPGHEASVIVGFRNLGNRPFYFHQVNAGLYYHLDAQVLLENYTALNYASQVQPGEDVSFNYRFYPHRMLQEGEYGLYIQAVYTDEYNAFQSTIYNKTIHILEPRAELTAKDVFQYGLILVVFGAGTFGLVKLSFGGKSRKRPSARGTRDDEEEWTKGGILEKKAQ